MSEDNEQTQQTEEGAPAPAPDGKGGAVKLIGIGLGSLLVGVAATWFGLQQMGGGEEAAAEAPESEDSAEAVEELDGAPFAERVIALDPIVVNLGSGGAPRYLKTKLSLELANAADVDVVTAQLPKIQDAIIVLLSSRRLSDIQEFSGKVLIKEDILDRVNGALDAPSVQSVLFTEFVVQ